ncbi:LuxR C-terminal-related transcriptional regulator [Methylobacterium sp. J-048]|uniref:response regulator transcription factor n=1 Tax=Methylobacterium sp. J-048 TaxID=2836635 RepID=UPI001FB9D7C2|nr:LuxR C-terminal-related transcriptional regulator [Methylobacterium sp. J-048]MCJ2056975.1 LuxR C-terminal-related transcriptional regulator [Methylobacterium sp. J-048]
MVQPCARTVLADTRLALTAREQEIIRHIALGAQNDGIAYEMGISANTVKTHIGNIMRKFGLHNRTQIAMLLTPRVTTATPVRPGRTLSPRLTP